MLNKGAESLPNQAAHDYKALAKLYDAKNMKKGLKSAQKILDNHPDHPETLAMKALFQLGLNEQDKAQATAKIALMKSKMQSMFCWHTYGTIHKHKKNYVQAAKCFQQAVNFQKDNMQILRETAALQIQVRDHTSHVATRWKLLKLKPNMIYNWAAFAVACHLKGDFQQLYKAISSIQNIRLSVQMKPVQLSHYFLYRAVAFRDGQDYQKMYQELKKNKSSILDQDIWHQLNYKASLKLKKIEQAKSSIQFLIKKYPENDQYIRKYKNFSQLSDRQLYQKLINDFSSKISKIYLLSVLEDKQEFSKEFTQFIKPYYQKNLISLFAQIQIIYQKSKHVDEIQRIFLDFEKSLKDNKYPDGSEAAFPTEYLWSMYLLAQHYSRKFQTLKSAYEYICKAITFTNTVSEFYIVKAEIEYKMHNNIQALKTINEARKTDLADRYMNNICIKYLMKCMKPSIAEEVLRLFMRDQASLYELQNQWYIIEAGKSFLKQRKFQPGLRHLNFIEKQFIDISSNQYDFHTYCVRKWTLRQYVQYIAFNDNIYMDKKYMQAAAWVLHYLPEYVHYLKEKQEKQKQELETKQQKTKKKKKKKNKKNNQAQQLPPLQIFRKKIDYDGKEYAQKIKDDPLAETLTIARNVASACFVNKQNKKQNKIFAQAFSEAIGTFIRFDKPLLVIRLHKKLVSTKSDAYLIHLWTVKTINYLNKVLAKEGVDQLIKQNSKEYLNQIGDNANEYHKKKSVCLQKNILSEIKNGQIQLVLSNKQQRGEQIKFYANALESIIKSQKKDLQSLQSAFYLTHKLEFYGQMTAEQKNSLNSQFGQLTTYFTSWLDQIEKLPENTWGFYWLSDYDQKRQEQYLKEDSKEDKKEEKQK